ncbi:chain-length determining protein [uncultured Bacteroides sp.]|uniref:chain-length determining protein n=1 Tax=uncultured Bacteroides sp. TaxID=162156 RepID=UPI002630790E|nr:chain-length determining protein [uncultured Bacteroides sp.]
MEDNKEYTNSEKQTDKPKSEASTSWMRILQEVISIRKSLYKAAGIGLILGVIFALSMPKEYTVSVSLSPEINSDAKATGGFAGLASSFLGSSSSLSVSPDALNAALAPDIISSTPFILDLLKVRVQSLDGEIDTTLVHYMEEESDAWWKVVLGMPKIILNSIRGLFSKSHSEGFNDKDHLLILSDEEAEIVDKLKKTIFVEIDNKTGITTISVTMQDPKVTAIVADNVLKILQNYIIEYRIAKAQKDCDYLETIHKERQIEFYKAQKKYAEYIDSNKNIILQSVKTEQERLQNEMNLAFQIYTQVAQQLQMARAKVQESKPVFAVVEPAKIPLQPSNSRKTIVLFFIVLAIGGTGGWIIYGKTYTHRILKDLKSNLQKNK